MQVKPKILNAYLRRKSLRGNLKVDLPCRHCLRWAASRRPR